MMELLQTELSQALQSLSEKAKSASEAVARLKHLSEKVNVSLSIQASLMAPRMGHLGDVMES